MRYSGLRDRRARERKAIGKSGDDFEIAISRLFAETKLFFRVGLEEVFSKGGAMTRPRVTAGFCVSLCRVHSCKKLGSEPSPEQKKYMPTVLC